MIKGIAIGLALGFALGWTTGNFNGIDIAHDAEPFPVLGPAALLCLRLPDSDLCNGFKLGRGWEQCAALRAQASVGQPLSDEQKADFVRCVSND